MNSIFLPVLLLAALAAAARYEPRGHYFYPGGNSSITVGPTATTMTYTTCYTAICTTGLCQSTYTVTERCHSHTCAPHTSDVPPGFTTTVTVCDHCATTPTTVTITYPVPPTPTTTHGCGGGGECPPKETESCEGYSCHPPPKTPSTTITITPTTTAPGCSSHPCQPPPNKTSSLTTLTHGCPGGPSCPLPPTQTTGCGGKTCPPSNTTVPDLPEFSGGAGRGHAGSVFAAGVVAIVAAILL